MLRRLLFILPLLIFTAAAAFFIWGLDPERDPGEIPSVLIDKPVPEFSLPPIRGSEPGESTSTGLSNADLSGEGITLVNVFASWCMPCRAEHSILTDLRREEDIRLVGINYKDEPEDALAWLDELGNPYDAIGADMEGDAGLEWGISGVPETFFVDNEGIIRYRHVGPIHETEIDDLILPILEELR